MPDSSRISPTAHYTSYVWFRHGMSHPALATRLGARLHRALRPMNLVYGRVSRRPNLDMMLLARHRVIDKLLERELVEGRIGQVIEVAAGLSARGWRFARRFPKIRYLEADLPAMAAHKRGALDAAGLRGDNHEVVEIDALAEEGPTSLAGLAAGLDARIGTAILTEGLLGYFDRPSIEGMWRRFATALRRFPNGLYLSDLNTAGDVGGMHSVQAFRWLLSAFARGQVHLHYDSIPEAEDALRRAGFATATLHLPGDVPDVDFPGRERRHVVRIVEARV